tara:strand:+ start:1058 stop:1210 length:153 start_codon:yes stop_codon:yes gene_type:complete
MTTAIYGGILCDRGLKGQHVDKIRHVYCTIIVKVKLSRITAWFWAVAKRL